MTLVDTQSTQLAGEPLHRRRLLWTAGAVFVLLLIVTSICGALPYDPVASSASHPSNGPGQTETAAQRVWTTIQAANVKATQCITGPTLSSPYVAIWELFGTPTPTPSR